MAIITTRKSYHGIRPSKLKVTNLIITKPCLIFAIRLPAKVNVKTEISVFYYCSRHYAWFLYIMIENEIKRFIMRNNTLKTSNVIADAWNLPRLDRLGVKYGYQYDNS